MSETSSVEEPVRRESGRPVLCGSLGLGAWSLLGVLALFAVGCAGPPPEKTIPDPLPDARFAALTTIEGQLFWPDSIDRETPGYRGAPIAGAEVGCYRLGEHIRLFPTVTTDEKGRFKLDKVELHTGQRFSIVVRYRQRRWAVVPVQRRRVGQRGGSRMDKIDRSELFNVVDTTRSFGGRYNSMEYRLKAGEVRPIGAIVWNETKKRTEPLIEPPVGVLAAKRLVGLMIHALPITPRGLDNWSDGKKEVSWLERRRGEKLDVRVDRLPRDLQANIERRLEDTWLIDRHSTDPGKSAARRTGLLSCDLMSFADGCEMTIDPAKGLASRRLKQAVFPLFRGKIRKRPSLAGKTIVLSPGHGFYRAPAGTTAAPANKPSSWCSPRTFMSRKVLPGLLSRGILEDDLTIQLCRELTWMLEVCGAKVVTLREVRDLGKEGVRRAGAGFEAWPKGAGGELPRLWEQTATYAIGAEHPDWLGSASDPYAPRSAAVAKAKHSADGKRDDNGKALVARIEALRRLAKTADAMVSVHTNALGNGAVQSRRRGPLALYLDIAATPEQSRIEQGRSVLKNANAGSEALGQAMMSRLKVAATAARAPLVPLSKHGRGIAVLRDTAPYFYEVPKPNAKNRTAGFRRSLTAPEAGVEPEALAGRDVTDASAGWYRQPFPALLPVVLVEAGFHDHALDGPLLDRGWYRRHLARAMLNALEDRFKATDPASEDQ